MVVKSFGGIFAFPCSVILLTNSASSLRILGTLNGFAVSISAVGRAIGPAIGGATFTWGLERGYMIAPWWLLGIIAAIGAIPIWFLVEMEGFSKIESDSDSDDEDEEELFPTVDEETGREIMAGDEVLAFEDDETLDTVEGPRFGSIRSRRSIDSHGRSKRISFDEQAEGETGKEEHERWKIERLERRMSFPIGVRGGSVGPGGGRKLSNGLAASNLGQGTGGTSFA